MKRVIALLLAILMIFATAFCAFAAVSPTAAPEDDDNGRGGSGDSDDNGRGVGPGASDDNGRGSNISPKTGYSLISEVGAVAAVVSCSAAGIVLAKKKED